METLEEVVEFIRSITADGFRGRLQARGEARALIRRNGLLPPEAPAFAENLDVDLQEYGFSLLRASLRARELGAAREIWSLGFERAGGIFESLVRNEGPESSWRGFFRVLGAAAYHLGGMSALAFSLMTQAEGARNLSPAERAFELLILRDLEQLSQAARDWLSDPLHSDGRLAQLTEAGQIDQDDIVLSIGTSSFFRAMTFFSFALQTGEPELFEESRSILERTISLAGNAGLISIWWISRIALHLIDDLWANSLHSVVPNDGPEGSDEYHRLRSIFLGSLYARSAAEVELWPSQIEAAGRATDLSDDLVVSLPTSAGKTRIAEIAALMALSIGKRVLIVTPLRALSAQTERSFRKTFAPLGFSVSSLYGSNGSAGGDEDALRTRHIVIATPEKLDFALRNNPSLIDDVGLVVLDEGHLIGPTEREVRYEGLVQRLLRRGDQPARRIVCLSAILPSGTELEDLKDWIRSDAPGTAIQSKWRPTRQRFGTISWTGRAARLAFDLETDGPYLRNFVVEMAPIRPRRTPFPRDNVELTLASAWRFVEQGKRCLVFCTQRNQVEGIAETAIDLCARGFVPNLLEDLFCIDRALAVGREWLGENHPALKCLQLGVAVHHARLPSPFLREIEALLSTGKIKLTIASPTLAQGLNLNAAVLLIPSLYRAGSLISGEEFANVAGRAGRAFVDLEGLVLHVMWNPEPWRRQTWRDLVASAKCRSLLSGMISVLAEVSSRLSAAGVFQRDQAFEYLANNLEAWHVTPPTDGADSTTSLIERLDAIVFSLIDDLESGTEDLYAVLQQALVGSLWARQIDRADPLQRQVQEWVLTARAHLIWNKTTPLQRRAQFAMGLGLESGLAIDDIAPYLIDRLRDADMSAIEGNEASLLEALEAIAERILLIAPFAPTRGLPDSWRALLRDWISGADIALGDHDVHHVEDLFVYRLAWALEALRMYSRTHGIESDVLEGSAAACLEAGLPKLNMAILVRAGLPSRRAAQAVVEQLSPAFVTRLQMIDWLEAGDVEFFSDIDDWPSPETSDLWNSFRRDCLANTVRRWEIQTWRMKVPDGVDLDARLPHRLSIDHENGAVAVSTPDHIEKINIRNRLKQSYPALFRVDVDPDGRNVTIERMGQGRATWE